MSPINFKKNYLYSIDYGRKNTIWKMIVCYKEKTSTNFIFHIHISRIQDPNNTNAWIKDVDEGKEYTPFLILQIIKILR